MLNELKEALGPIIQEALQPIHLELQDLKCEVQNVKGEIQNVKGEVQDLKSQMNSRFDTMEIRVSQVETKMDAMQNEIIDIKKGQERQDKILESLAMRSLEQETELRELKRVK